MAGIFYQLFIRPIELILEVIYGYSKVLLGNSGLSIFVLSLFVSLLLLPFYNRADAIQAKQREKEKSLEKWISHIKKTFSGNEQFMMLQTYYRQNDYKPYHVLKGMLPLLLQVPFFMAAYHFLSHLAELTGTPFGPIRSLGAPDGLLAIGPFTLNLLPILMTLINLISGSLYTRGLPLKDKLQLYGMALLFLWLLYDSPAGLALYWTLNNCFSLVKNLIHRFPALKRIGAWALAAAGCGGILYILLFYRGGTAKRRLLLILLLLALVLWMLGSLFKDRLPGPRLPAADRLTRRIFTAGCLFLTVLTGFLIPAQVIVSSPGEFVQTADFYSPLVHIGYSLLLAAGLFFIWPQIFYALAGEGLRQGLGIGAWLLSGFGLVNYMFFGTGLGTLSPELQYQRMPHFSAAQILLNLMLLILLGALMLLLWKKKKIWVAPALFVLCLAAAGLGGYQSILIHRESGRIEAAVAGLSRESYRIPLSRKGKNVVVMMMDRAVSAYLPVAFQEKPELKEQFGGFTYYPNTLSYGAHTNFGAPALFGGYEYTPLELNKRTGELLKDKHNEALKLMPHLFYEQDYEVTVLDPPYANYSIIPDLSIFDAYPGLNAFVAESGPATDTEAFIQNRNELWRRNFFCYSVMKTAPLLMQETLYQGGSYFEPNRQYQNLQIYDSPSRARGNRLTLLKAMKVLDTLEENTRLKEEGDTFLLMANVTTHENQLLAAPDYAPAEQVDNTLYDAAHTDRFTAGGRQVRVENYLQMSHYHVNMAMLIRVGAWLDFLREAGVYDNTRIIIAADHGDNQNVLENTMFGEDWQDDAMYYNPLFLVKDFGAREFTVDDRFMTNADTPLLAFEGLLNDPVNPFTGAPVTDALKHEPQQLVFASHEHNIETNNGTVFLPGPWYAVSGEVLDKDSWSFLDIH